MSKESREGEERRGRGEERRRERERENFQLGFRWLWKKYVLQAW